VFITKLKLYVFHIIIKNPVKLYVNFEGQGNSRAVDSSTNLVLCKNIIIAFLSLTLH